MGTEIKTWQIVDGHLSTLQTELRTEGRTEPYDLEPWIASQPSIVCSDLLVIGRQVATRSGPIDLLGIDSSGNTVIIELKRDELPRECLAQAIDYASDVAGWTVERLNEVCVAYTGKTLEFAFNQAFPDVDAENLNINSTQRIALVGFAIESSLERMIEWLSDAYGVNVNAIVLSYVKTRSGDELLTRTSIISEEMEQERSRKQKKFESARRPWSNDTFFADAAGQLTEADFQAVKTIFEAAIRLDCEVSWGSGGKKGSFSVKDSTLCRRSFITVFSNGRLDLHFGWLSENERAQAIRDRFIEIVIQQLHLPPADYRDKTHHQIAITEARQDRRHREYASRLAYRSQGRQRELTHDVDSKDPTTRAACVVGRRDL